MKKQAAFLLATFLLFGCERESSDAPAESVASPQDHFFTNLSALCGNAYEGRLVSDDPVDADFAAENLIMHVRDCGESQIRIPLHVGDDRSRIWVITKTDAGLRLEHDHRHEDGEPDTVTLYGGNTVGEGLPGRQEFPANQYSKDLFEREGLAVSVANVWALEVSPGETFAYELRRPSRFFRAEFDLAEAVPLPPPAWDKITE